MTEKVRGKRPMDLGLTHDELEGTSYYNFRNVMGAVKNETPGFRTAPIYYGTNGKETAELEDKIPLKKDIQ